MAMGNVTSKIWRITLVLSGIGFGLLWIEAHMLWAAMAFIPNVMANDSGQASAGQHLSLIGGMFSGQVLAGMAGIPGGLAFFWRGIRKWLIGTFILLFVGGVSLQVHAVASYFGFI